MQKILDRILITMKEKEMTGRRMCKELGINETNLTQWKKGRPGYQKYLPEIARILGCTVEYLTTGKESPAEVLWRKYQSASERDRKIVDLILGVEDSPQ